MFPSPRFIAIVAVGLIGFVIADDWRHHCSQSDPTGCKSWSYDGCNFCDCAYQFGCTYDRTCEEEKEPYCRDFRCPKGCLLWYDGCHDIICDTMGTEIGRKEGYCKYSYDPWNATCKKRVCPKTCRLWTDGCNNYKCKSVGKLGRKKTDKSCDQKEDDRCIKYDCDNEEGWTKAKTLWCCKKKGKNCLCDGMKKLCDKEGSCGGGKVCKTLPLPYQEEKEMKVCCNE